MRRLTMLLAVLALLMGPAHGHARSAEAQTDLDAALKKAQAEEKMLFIVYGRDTCGNTRAVKEQISRHAIRLSDSEFVYAELNCDDPATKRLFRQRYRIEGRTLPYVVIADSGGKQLVARSGYGKAHEFSQLIRAAEKTAAGEGQEARAAGGTVQGAADSELRTWAPRNRQEFTAKLVEVKGGLAVFEGEDGSRMSLPLSIFGADDQRYIKQRQSGPQSGGPSPDPAGGDAAVPSRWLKGPEGYARALELQRQKGTPILVWITWHTCRYCKAVDGYLNRLKSRQALGEFIRVVIDQKAGQAEADLCRTKGFSGGNFYVLAAATDRAVAKQWAWKPNTREIVEDLEQVLAEKLRAAAKTGGGG